MRIALLQLNARLGDPEGNGRKLEGAYAEAIQSGAELALAPELAIPGYLLEDRLWEPGIRRRIEGESLRLAALTGPVPLVFGTARPAPSICCCIFPFPASTAATGQKSRRRRSGPSRP